jgi:hypothetical protein
MYDTDIKIIKNMIDLKKKPIGKEVKSDVEKYGDASLKTFLIVLGIAYLSVFIWNHFVS